MKRAMADLACEYWKLLRAFERSAGAAPEDARTRLAAQARYAGEKLDSILRGEGLRLVAFDGQRFEVNLPAVAVNAEDFLGDQDTLVERTLEPAIVSDEGVLVMGKVFLASAR